MVSGILNRATSRREPTLFALIFVSEKTCVASNPPLYCRHSPCDFLSVALANGFRSQSERQTCKCHNDEAITDAAHRRLPNISGGRTFHLHGSHRVISRGIHGLLQV